MKKSRKILIAACAAAAVLVGGGAVLNGITARAKCIPVSEPDFAALEDGKYSGEYSIAPVSVKAEVTVENHRMTDIEILEHFCGLGQKAEAVCGTVLEQQSLQVDSVSGATVSSKCILKAVEQALTEEKQ